MLTGEEDWPFGVAIAGTDVVFTTGLTQVGDQAVRVAPLSAGQPAASRILVARPGGQIPNGAIAIDGDTAYVAVGAGVVRVALATGAVAPFVDGRPITVTAVAVDATYVWWTTSLYKAPADAEVARRSKAGGPVEVLATGPGYGGSFTAVVPDGDGAFVASPQGVLRVAPGVVPVVVVSADALGGAPTRIAVDADRVYGVIAGGRNDLFSVPRGGGSKTELARKADATADLTVAGSEVLFFPDSSTLAAVPVGGGTPRIVAKGRYAAGDIAVAGDRVVFSADSRVWSAPIGSP